MPKAVKSKKCSRCGRWKRVKLFPKHPDGKHGLAAWCRKCHREYSRNRYWSTK